MMNTSETINTNEQDFKPHLVFWEATKRCNLKCIHCRAVPTDQYMQQELSTQEVYTIIDNIAEHYSPIFVLSGGEPLLREDILTIAHYASEKLMVALATNGTLISQNLADKMSKSGISRISISIDGPNKEVHDSFRKVPGAFDQVLMGIKYLQNAGISVQINTTVVNHNVQYLQEILSLSLSLNIDALHFFLLVPTGCGMEISQTQMLTAEKYEETLSWIYDQSIENQGRMFIKATCAPHYFRIMAQKNKERHQSGSHSLPFMKNSHHVKTKINNSSRVKALTKGCLAGTGICFIDHVGKVYPCGYLPVECGDLRKEPFSSIWSHSRVFEKLRTADLLEGKCGACEYRKICEGCRARAYYDTGNYMSEEPYCTYTPSTVRN